MIQLQFNLPDIREQDIKDYVEKELVTEPTLRKYIDLIILGFANNPRQNQTIC